MTTDTMDTSAGLLRTGEVAAFLGVSRQHVVDLCERGDLPFVTIGSHRRIRPADAEAVRAGASLTRDQERSLWLGHAVAAKLVADPERVLAKARRNLASAKGVRFSAAAGWLGEWEDLLAGPVVGVLDALTSRSPRARELRQNSPFAGVLSDEERRRVLAAFSNARRPSDG